MPRMPNNITTPASVAARLTDEEILRLAEMCFYEDPSVEEDQQTAAVLRDYVRMRSENEDLRRRLKVAKIHLGEIAEYDRHPEGMDDPWCADGHCCAEKARHALAAIREVGGAE